MHTRSSYRYDEVTWGAKFLPMFEEADHDHNVHLNLHRISSCERAELPADLPSGNPSPVGTATTGKYR
ncbi:MAG: hypothetical protein ICV83_03355 [Cytophagales bacterium]|nr:hypothetical protein [Cytophagales bacterium]